MSEAKDLTMTLILDNDEELKCTILGKFMAQEQNYIALVYHEGEQSTKNNKLLFYRLEEREGKEPELSNIKDDEEYKMVVKTFGEWFQTDGVG